MEEKVSPDVTPTTITSTPPTSTESTGPSLPLLPKELWLYITSYLPPVLQGLARSVCREWRDIIPLNQQVMHEATLLLKGYDACATWALKRGAPKALTVKLERNEGCPLVFDCGSHMTYAGYSGDEGPRTAFCAITGRPRFETAGMKGMGQKDTYVGDEAQSNRGVLAMKYPMRNGIVEDWDLMERVWHHTFYNELCVAPEEHPVLLTEAPRNPKSNREKMIQIMFETFNTEGCWVANPGALALYATARTCGLTVCCGEVISITPFDQGHIRQHAVQRINNIAGSGITDYLVDLLMERGHDFSNTTAEREAVRDIKEKLCYVAEDYDEELKTAMSSSSRHASYELPDGQTITLNEERFKAPEALFNPSVLGYEIPSLPRLIHNSIMKCAMDSRKFYYGNVILVGGTTMLPGLASRVEKELATLKPPSVSLRVVAPPERKYSVWIGGSILTSLSSFHPLWITKEDYDEYGPTLAHKCY